MGISARNEVRPVRNEGLPSDLGWAVNWIGTYRKVVDGRNFTSYPECSQITEMVVTS